MAFGIGRPASFMLRYDMHGEGPSLGERNELAPKSQVPESIQTFSVEDLLSNKFIRKDSVHV